MEDERELLGRQAFLCAFGAKRNSQRRQVYRLIDRTISRDTSTCLWRGPTDRRIVSRSCDHTAQVPAGRPMPLWVSRKDGVDGTPSAAWAAMCGVTFVESSSLPKSHKVKRREQVEDTPSSQSMSLLGSLHV